MKLREGLKIEIAGLCLIALAVLGLICLLSPSEGFVGGVLEKVLKTLAGEGRFLFPLLLGVLGWQLIRSGRKVQLAQNILGFVLLLLVALTLIHSLVPSDYTARSFLEGDGGGLIGAFLSFVLQQSFGRAGAYVILLTMGLISLLMLTGVSLSSVTELLVRWGWKGVKKNLFERMGFLSSFYKGGKEQRVKDVPVIIDYVEKDERVDGALPDEDGQTKDMGRERIVEGAAELAAASEVYRPGTNGGRDSRCSQLVFSRVSRESCNPGDLLRPPPGCEGEARADGVYRLPPLELLACSARSKIDKNDPDIAEKIKVLEATLNNFGVKVRVTRVSRGPSVTRYEIQPPPGVKVSRIVGLSDDIALGLAAPGVRIEAPIPGRAAVGIEVPNQKVSPVRLRDLLESDVYLKARSRLTVALGKDIGGNVVAADLAAMPHLLIAGATGSGKSVCLNTIIASILFKATPEEVKFLVIDPKMVELATFNGIPHLVSPVVTDPRKAATALRWAVKEMEYRYELFAGAGARDVEKYNALLRQRGRKEDQLPQMVIIIDELADLMMVAPADVEDAICRLAQMARAGGMHLVVATQRPSVDVITGLIKANIPSRISFNVSSQIDSRTILDMVGAEKLLSRGDMLFYPVGAAKPVRLQGAFISDREVELLVNYLRKQAVPPQVQQGITLDHTDPEASGPDDELLSRAAQLFMETGQASISLLQRRLRIGYARAARLMDALERRGFVGGPEGSKPRAVLISKEQYQQTFKKIL
ncbi:MAG: DNA translocase FtsK 4TM domain-containing protein [Bacillota bacterium]|jgi:S-DNA-T family DNA segregation ATPase FtsK/SpoIIIE